MKCSLRRTTQVLLSLSAIVGCSGVANTPNALVDSQDPSSSGDSTSTPFEDRISPIPEPILLIGENDLPIYDPATDSDVSFEECVGQRVVTETLPVNVYILFDTSCSMSCPPELTGPGQCCTGGPNPRMTPVRRAVGEFLMDEKSTELRAGIGYFGNQPLGSASCVSNDYAQAAVEVDFLSNSAPSIIESLDNQVPQGETPTGSALRGACKYSSGWKRDHPGNAISLILVTDGVPEAPATRSCNPSINDASAAARECQEQGIQTYVVGIGANLENLDQLAFSGGTDSAYLVSGDSSVASEVLDALLAIGESAVVPCEFTIPSPPSGDQLDPSLVNVNFVEPGDVSTLIGNVANSSKCAGGGGWYYNDSTHPTSVILCDASCGTITEGLTASANAGTGAIVELQFGCTTVQNIR